MTRNFPFHASNGIVIPPADNRGDIAKPHGLYLQASLVVALREMFQAERDAELGVWRDPETKAFTVREVTPVVNGASRTVVVFDERQSRAFEFSEFYARESGASNYAIPVAQRWFDAHPLLVQPWHDAKKGEFWLVSVNDGPENPAIVAGPVFGSLKFLFVDESAISVRSPKITNATRQWPAESETR